MSVEAYHDLGEVYLNGKPTELLRGVVLNRMPASPQHTFLVDELEARVRAVASPEQVVRREHALTLADSEPEPDVALVAGSREDYRFSHPATALLVMEVSLSTEERDREKISIYAEAGIGEYWLVFPEEKLIEVHVAPIDGRYTRVRVYRTGEKVVSEALPSLEVTLDELFQV